MRCPRNAPRCDGPDGKRPKCAVCSEDKIKALILDLGKVANERDAALLDCAELAILRDSLNLQIGELRKALAFYADEKEWRDTADNYGQVWVFDWPGDLRDNPWDIAKAALAEKPKCECGNPKPCEIHRGLICILCAEEKHAGPCVIKRKDEA